AWTTIERFNRWERVTELAFDSWADWHAATGPQSSPRYTPPAYGPRGLVAETIFVGEEPDDDFLGGGAPERPDRLLRWLFLLRYPEGVPTADGEAWYLGTHTQEAKHIPGLRRYVSWRAAPRPPDVGDQRPSRWDRVTELAF